MNTNEEQDWAVERRKSPRHTTRREAHLLFIASLLAVESKRPPQTLIGYTRDISETGLSLIVTSTRISDYDLCGLDSLLRIKLSLPLGVVEMESEVVRSEWVEQEDPRQGYFVGVRITEMSDEDRRRYSEYLAICS